MEMDVDTFLVAVYVTVDDLYRERYAPEKPRRPGPEPELSDSEILTLALLEQWRPDHSETAFLVWVRTHWQRYFPRLLSQSAFNRRVRDLAGVLCRLGPDVCQMLERLVGTPDYEVIDAVPVPLMRRRRGEHHRLFANEAQVGRGGTDRSWFYGCSLLDAVTPDGGITGFVVGPAKTEGHWLADTLLRWRCDPAAAVATPQNLRVALGPDHPNQRIGPTGPIRGRLAAGVATSSLYLGDGGFRGRYWRAHWASAYGAQVATTADPGVTPELHAWYASARQVVETVHSCLVGTFGLTFPGARSAWGLLARLAAKVAAFNVALLINVRFGRPPFSIFNPLD
jgi:hypothetical protein